MFLDDINDRQEEIRRQVEEGKAHEEDIPEVNEEDFRYPGPIPQTKESAIISLADSVESASRSLEKPTHSKIGQLVEDIATMRLRDGQLDDCDLYTSCEPCPMCLGAIYWARLRRVFYGGTHEDAAAAGFDDHFIYDELALPPEERHIAMIPLMRDEAQRAFDVWTDNKDRIEY